MQTALFKCIKLLSAFGVISKTKLVCIEAMPYYAVRVGRQVGVFNTWEECSAQVKNFTNARYKKFSTLADAEAFVLDGRGVSQVSTPYVNNNESSSSSQSAYSVKPSLPSTSNSRTTYGVSKVSSPSPYVNKHGASSSTSSVKPSLPSTSNSTTAYDKLMSSMKAVENTLDGLQVILKTKSSDKHLVKRLHTGIPHHEKGLVTKELRTSSGRNSTSHGPAEDTEQTVNQREYNLRRAGQTSTPSASNATDRLDRVQYQGHSGEEITVFTDGACFQNGQSGARAGIGVYWGPDHPWNVSERVTGRQTNNRAEICAAVKAIQQARSAGYSKVVVKTDSQFLINCITKWHSKWEQNNWRLANGSAVKNEEELKELLNEVRNPSVGVRWEHVRGHCGIPGNEEADRLANEGARKSLPGFS